MSERSELGAFLTARRAAVTPAQASVDGMSRRRRVQGLRREEVATRAGVSVDYYARLEQGRERHPSLNVLAALSRALLLDEDARQHMFLLAGVRIPAAGLAYPVSVASSLSALVERWMDTPAFLINGRMDVMASNLLARMLHDDFAAFDNLARMIFLDPAASRFFTDWTQTAETCVGNLRWNLESLTVSGEDEWLLKQLQASAPFRQNWDRYHVRAKTADAKSFHHSKVGPLILEYHTFDVRGAVGAQLVLYNAEPGSASDTALRLLGSLGLTHDWPAEP